jgi:hypothetical protein
MTSEPSRDAALTIGAVLGDSDAENMAWKRAINRLGKQIQKARQGVDSPMRLNVVYHVDGKLVPNEFTGVRTGRFRKSDTLLMVQAAVPPGPNDDRGGVLLGLLVDAIAEAETYARARGIAPDLEAIREMVKTLPLPKAQ